jgi:hypothetical protein
VAAATAAFVFVACGGVAAVPGTSSDASTVEPFDATTGAPGSDGGQTGSDGGVGDATSAGDGEDTTDAGGVVTRFCYPEVCPTGCCTAEGLCVSPSTSSACGYGGEACTECPAGASCVGGACLTPVPNCGPSNCAGCCQGPDLCASGTAVAACGQGGQACSRCAPYSCAPQLGGGGQCGICYRDCYGCCGTESTLYCSRGLYQDECGSNGEDCTACAADQQCAPASTSGGTCVPANPACNATNCTGCCQGDICAVGDQDVACGAQGANCVDCASYKTVCTQGGCSM